MVVPTFRSLAILDVKETYRFPRHQHLFYEVIFVDAGRYECLLNGEKLLLAPGEILIVRIGDWHQDDLEPPLRYFGLHFTLGNESESSIPLFNQHILASSQQLRVPRREFWGIIERIQQESANDTISPYIQDALLLEFFWRLIRLLPRETLSPYFFEHSFANAFSVQLMRLFQEKMTTNLGVNEMAESLHMSPSSLAHKCSAILGMSPVKAFTHFRMERAKELIRETTMQIKEISNFLGFENQYHFSRVFKKTFGLTPSACRKNTVTS